MRQSSNKEKIRQFMKELGHNTKEKGRVYLTGGATAVLFEWRDMTIDIDIKPVPDSDEIFRAIESLKNKIDVNIELASPGEFIPPLPGWEERSLFVEPKKLLHLFNSIKPQLIRYPSINANVFEEKVREVVGYEK